MPEPVGMYGLALPNETELDYRFKYQVQYWHQRNQFINDVRRMLCGLNKISAPKSTQYKVKILHTYILASLVNEKTSRFTHLPNIQTIPEVGIDDDARAKINRIEQGLNIANDEMDRRGDADVWGWTI